MAAILVRSDCESEVHIPNSYTRWMTNCAQCSTHYHLAYSLDEAQLKPRPTGTVNTRDQLMHDATIAVTSGHPGHATELFLWGPAREWNAMDVARDSIRGG
jgi:hypothetical protein